MGGRRWAGLGRCALRADAVGSSLGSVMCCLGLELSGAACGPWQLQMVLFSENPTQLGCLGNSGAGQAGAGWAQELWDRSKDCVFALRVIFFLGQEQRAE